MSNMFSDLESVELPPLDDEDEEAAEAGYAGDYKEDDGSSTPLPAGAVPGDRIREPKRRGRPPKKREPEPGAPPPPPVIAAPPSLETWKARIPAKNIDEGLPWIFEHLGELGWMPEHIRLRITRLTNTPGGKPVQMDPEISGTAIQGNPSLGLLPSTACNDHIIEHFHSRIPNLPNTFLATVRGLNGVFIMNTEPFTWESYDSMMAARRRMKTSAEQHGTPVSFTELPAAHRGPALPAMPVAPQQPPAPGATYAQGYAEAENAALRAQNEEFRRAMAEGRQPREIQMPTPPQVDIQAEIAKGVAAALEAAGVKPKGTPDMVAEMRSAAAAAVAAGLEAAGIKPKTEADAQTEREVRLLGKVSELLEARLGPAPVGAAGVPAPGAPAPTMAEIIKNAAARKALAEQEIADARAVLGVQETPQAPTEIVQERDEEDGPPKGMAQQMFEGVVKGVAQDPMGAVMGIAGFIAPFIEGSPAGALIAKAAAGAAEAVRQKAVRESVQMPTGGVRRGGL